MQKFAKEENQACTISKMKYNYRIGISNYLVQEEEKVTQMQSIIKGKEQVYALPEWPQGLYADNRYHSHLLYTRLIFSEITGSLQTFVYALQTGITARTSIWFHDFFTT